MPHISTRIPLSDTNMRIIRSLSTTSTTTKNDDIDTRGAPIHTHSNENNAVHHQHKPLSTTFSELSKLRLSALVVSTTSVGFLSVGAVVPMDYTTFVSCCVGTALCSSSASTLNQIFEIDRDARMRRTRNRPLPRGDVTPRQATGLALMTGSAGGLLLWTGTDPVTTMLGMANIGLYAGLYTHLKPRSELNTWVGAVVGAIPPVMGWTAATAAGAGATTTIAVPLLLGTTLYLWQFPHFFALSWMHRVDYHRGGFQMVPVNDPTGDRTAQLIGKYALYLTTLPFVSTYLDVTSSMFAVEGIFLNSYALYVAGIFYRDRSNANARKVFTTSLWYLPSLLTLFILHSKTWREKDKNKHEQPIIMTEGIQLLTDFGKSMCVHEKAIQHVKNINEDNEEEGKNDALTTTNKTEDNCPVVFGKAKAKEATAVVNNSVQNVTTVVTTTSQLENHK